MRKGTVMACVCALAMGGTAELPRIYAHRGGALEQDANTLGAEFLSVQLDSLCRAFVKDAHKAGLKLTAWTVRTPEDAQLAILLGTDFVTTDVPAAQLEQGTARP